MEKIALVIGAGAFGTSIASVLAQNFSEVILKVRSQDIYEAIKKNENPVYLPGLALSPNIKAAISWEELDDLTQNKEVSIIVNGLPTSAIDHFYSQNQARFAAYFAKGIPMVSLSKGIDTKTLELPDDIFDRYFYEHNHLITFLSGPSFAKEIVEKQITIVSLGGKSPKALIAVSQMLCTHYFKAFPTYDVKGVLLGGALKNILAIAGGIVEGLGFNHNTQAAMITRGITEMLRFGKVFNARPETFYSFSGMGDLILTTTSSLSRNKTFGLELAKGREPLEIINSQRSVVEGYKTTKAAHQLAEDYGIRASLFNGVYRILYEGVPPQVVIDQLMSIPIENID